MKNLKTVITLVILSSVAVSGIASAASLHNSALSSLIYEESSDIFSVTAHTKSTNDNDIRSYGDNYNKESVWSTEYEQYVNSADFKRVSLETTDVVNQYVENNPTASENLSTEVFVYNENAGEYHLQ